MRKLLLCLFVFISVSLVSLLMISTMNAEEQVMDNSGEQLIFDETAGDLRLAIAQTGKITSLIGIPTGENYIARKEISYLLECGMYNGDSSIMLQPVSAKTIKKDANGTAIELFYDKGITLTVLITPKQGWFRMELVKAEPVAEVSQVTWGPYRTTMRGHIAEWLGINRSNNFAIGLLSLEPNTDAASQAAALHTDEGSLTQLSAYDHTRGRFIAVQYAVQQNHHVQYNNLRNAVPIPVTTVGSAVALYGCPSGRTTELSVIEKIVLAEGLPHPTYEGVWNKYTNAGKRFCIWANYNEKNFEEYLNLAKALNARILCMPSTMMSNWGHFDISPDIYPGGIPAILEDSKEAKKSNIGLTLYSLTTFLKPNPAPEPYISPVPDDRLQTWKPETKLSGNVSATDTDIAVQYGNKDVEAALNATRVIRIDNEMITFKHLTVDGDRIIVKECQRGSFCTQPAEHQDQSRIRLMYVAGYNNFYPGTLDMSNECSECLSNILLQTDHDNFIVDGYESCYETGYGTYTANIFLKNFFEKLAKNNKEILTTTSCSSHYSWHFMSHISWGEGDHDRGFRFSMLDCRLARQLELARNLLPNKMGQYSGASDTTAEDINWVMALATGWDSGVDFWMNPNSIKNNPEYEQVAKTFSLWEQAKAENAFSEHQKMLLRQSDVLYKLTHKTDGGWDLKFDRRWQNKKVKILPSSVMNATPGNGGTESVKPLSIDWSWTHNPALYNEIGLSDDLVAKADSSETSWKVSFPAYTEDPNAWYHTNNRHFQYVIRVPENAPSAVKNFRVSVNGKSIEIPATLQPGQYLSIPHLVEIACIYDKNHQVLSEVYLYGDIQHVQKGQTATVALSCEAVEKDTTPNIIMNVRCQNGYFYHK
ncbi:MAG: hypothetical protein LBU34_00640 [Planctomycetaceae bacterium]|jgi:hypothetical protein|nr:hypothetical protein [Planctomycetaceae bacterium]